MLSGLGPSAMTRAMFQEYLMCSSVVPAVPWITRVELPLMAAARCSLSQLLPVPGSPTSSRARSEASVTMARFDDGGVAEELAGDLDLLLFAGDGGFEGFAAGDVGEHRARGHQPRCGRRVGVVLLQRLQLRRVNLLGRAAQDFLIAVAGHFRFFRLFCHRVSNVS